MPNDTEVNTINDSLVGIQGEYVVIVSPKRFMSQAQAIRMAAWIVALTDKDEFNKVLAAVMTT